FQVLPVIVFFGALTGVLYYYGIIQRVVGFFAWMLQRILKISGPESLATSANIFLGQSESPLLIRSYLGQMSRSEIFQVMVAGMSMLAGSVLALYIGFLGGGNETQQLFFAKHLIAASVMAAPGAIVVAKIMIPQTATFETRSKPEKKISGPNLLSSLFTGASDGMKLAVNVAVMLIVFIAFIALFNYLAMQIGTITHLNKVVAQVSGGRYTTLSLQFILGYCFAPIMWLIGVCPADTLSTGRLLGEKIVLTELIGYLHLSELKSAGVFVQQKSIIMSTYMLSGFANFASIGVQIACIGTLAPGKKTLVSEIGLKAMVAGTLTSLLSACMVGMVI
ncbi:MAG TPA: nucleoside transporter C-terminal domain-containing protein, partial [Bacteroidales bacterium]